MEETIDPIQLSLEILIAEALVGSGRDKKWLTASIGAAVAGVAGQCLRHIGFCDNGADVGYAQNIASRHYNAGATTDSGGSEVDSNAARELLDVARGEYIPIARRGVNVDANCTIGLIPSEC